MLSIKKIEIHCIYIQDQTETKKILKVLSKIKSIVRGKDPTTACRAFSKKI